ncbi:hypothetical protein GCM10020218_045500 [Dactylosporangium vinaceum]
MIGRAPGLIRHNARTCTWRREPGSPDLARVRPLRLPAPLIERSKGRVTVGTGSAMEFGRGGACVRRVDERARLVSESGACDGARRRGVQASCLAGAGVDAAQ